MNTKLLVCDLDNTLYDWVSYFVQSFYSMVDEVVELTKCDRDQLLDDFRTVHRKYHDLEHPFALLETKIIRDIFTGHSTKEIANRLDSSFRAFNVSRRNTLRLYPGVQESLRELKQAKIKLVAHTESNLFAAVDRLMRLELIDSFERVYCRTRARSVHPDPQARLKWFERYPLEKFYEFSDNQRKPNAEVLLEICSLEGARVSDTAYVGDSIARDIMMAVNAGVYAIWAEYGAHHAAEDYTRLVRVTHWTAEDVAREERLKTDSKNIVPDAILRNNFREIVQVFKV